MREGWRKTTIASLISEGVITDVQDGNHGNDHPKASDYVMNGVPFLMARDIQNGSVDIKNCAFLRKEQADGLRIGFAKPGDILLSHKGTVGAVAKVPAGFEYVMLTPQVTYYRVGDSRKLNPDYLLQFFNGPEFQSRLAQISGQSTRAYIGITEQKRLSITVPPISEQRKIAEILRTWDDAIEACERLIASKQSRLAAARQKLYAATRPGADPREAASWDETTLGSIFTEIGEANPGLGPEAVITVGKYAIRRQVEHFTRSVASANLGNYQLLKPGDFVYDPMSAYYGAIGRYAGDSLGIVSPAYTVIRLIDGINPAFVEGLLKSHYIAFELENRSSQGNREGKRRTLRSDEFSSIPFLLPPRAEQDRVADVLMEIARDLQLTTKSRDALAKQKRGLMQKLLTGEWRVKIAKEAAHG